MEIVRNKPIFQVNVNNSLSSPEAEHKNSFGMSAFRNVVEAGRLSTNSGMGIKVIKNYLRLGTMSIQLWK